MREYELTYLVSDDVPEADLKKITDKVAGFITNDGGKVTKEESWGRRKLAYPILKLNFATYITIWFEMEATKLSELDHELRVFPQVIRHLTTLKVEKSEVLKVTREDIVGTSEVEGVIGAKSFEVVEGETEASKDLMAVREKDEDESEGKIAQENVEKPETEKIETKKEEKTEEKIEDLPVDAEHQATPAGMPSAKPMAARQAGEKPQKVEKAKVKKPVEEVIETGPGVEEKTEITEKPKKTAKAKKIENPAEEPAIEKKSEEDEADRIKKLDEKLDELLGDDL